MLYISFDQATTTTGFSIFKDRELIEFGKFSKEGDIFMRFSAQKEAIISIIKENKDKYPKEKIKVTFEDIQLQGNVQTFKDLARLQGTLITAVLETFPEAELELMFSSSWKSFAKVKGKSRVEQKRNSQAIALEKFGVKVTQDEADALLIGYSASHKEVNWE